jgi:hypothetical protein
MLNFMGTIRAINRNLVPRSGEVSLKAFVIDEADRHEVSHWAIRKRIARGRMYPHVRFRRVNRRTVWVKK